MDENNLYYTKKSDIINNNPKIKSQSKTFKNAYFNNKELSRNNLIEESRSEYLLHKEKLMLNYPCYSPNQSHSINLDYLPHRPITNKNMKNRKTLTDYWNLRYDLEKENEEVYFLKKQNLSHIKNLIDETLKLRKKSKSYNYDKYLDKLEKKNLIRKAEKIKKDNMIKAQEKFDKLLDKVDRKQKEKEFNKECKIRIEIEKIKEKKRLENQNDLIQKQKNWEVQNYEHMTRVENMHQQKHEFAVNEYLLILKKGIKRYERIDERKNEMNIKNQIKNEERKLYLINYKMKNKELEKNIRKKFEKKQENISKFYLVQKEIKENEIQKRKEQREEKFKENLYNRLLNKNKEKQKRKELLDIMERKEEITNKRKILNAKFNEEYKLNNLLKSEEICDNYIRKRNILNYKNRMKLQRMKNKDIEINNKMIRRINSAKTRISRFNQIKLNRDLTMGLVKEILEDKKDHEPEEVYKKVFTKEEIKLLKE